MVEQPISAPAIRKIPRRWGLWKSLAIVLLIFAVTVAAGVWYTVRHAGPILRSRLINTLSNRFNSKVELDGFQVSVLHGIEVSGTGLQIFGSKDPNAYQAGIQPLIEIREFRFHTALRSLLRTPMHVDTVYVKGMVLNVPPSQRREEFSRMGTKAGRMTILVDKFICEDTLLVINTVNPETPPLEFAISKLTMKDIGSGLPLAFEATLTNPKPVGEIQSSGLFGPWRQNAPRETPLQGKYSFQHADLSTIKGIGGTLDSTGEYSGTLNNIAVHGVTDTPNFRLASGGHAVALHTEFHAIVDGTCGDTYLKPVQAAFLHTSLTANGSVIRLKRAHSHGHDIVMDVILERGRIEDLLKLGIRTNPPVMTGPVALKAKFRLSPGEAPVADRLNMAGEFHVVSAHFTNGKVQAKLNSLSLLSRRGKPLPSQDGDDAPTDLQGAFTLNEGMLAFSNLHFLVPGTEVDMTGGYSLDGRQFDFHGTARLEAKLSQMTRGWKSLLLKPVDPFFSKNGAGTEIPIKITGTESAPRFGLDFHRKEAGGPKAGDTLSRR